MTEINDPHIAAMAWTAQPGCYIKWAPGDCTLYRVQIINLYPSLATPEECESLSGLLVRLGDLKDTQMILVPQLSFGELWSARLWLRWGFPVGWWAAVRPLLAALGWAEGEASFRLEDTIEISRLVSAHG